MTPPAHSQTSGVSMFAVVDREEVEGRKFRGMNPAFVRRVWAKRREMVRQEPKPAPAQVQEKTRAQMIAEKAVERQRLVEQQRIERLRQRMEAGGVQGIIAEVALAHRVTVADILSQGRSKPLVKARHEAIVEVAIRRPAFSLSQIGRCFSRDHTTVLHVLNKYGVRGAGEFIHGRRAG